MHLGRVMALNSPLLDSPMRTDNVRARVMLFSVVLYDVTYFASRSSGSSKCHPKIGKAHCVRRISPIVTVMDTYRCETFKKVSLW